MACCSSLQDVTLLLLLLRSGMLLLVLVPCGLLLLLWCGWDDDANVLLIRLQVEAAAATQHQVSNSNRHAAQNVKCCSSRL
jgi:hypothetical protein